MTSKYLDPIPPVGVNHIEYAIERANLSVRRTMLKNEEDIRIVKAHAVGANLYLTIRRPLDPYELEPDELDESKWVEIPRVHRRFSVQEVVDSVLNGEVLLLGDYSSEAPEQDKINAVIGALWRGGVTVLPADVEIKVDTFSAEITSKNPVDLMWWGKGRVKLRIAEVV